MSSQELGENEEMVKDFYRTVGIYTPVRKDSSNGLILMTGDRWMQRRVGEKELGAIRGTFTAPLFTRGNRRDYDH